MAVNLISSNDTTINQTDDDIQVNFSTTRNQQISDIESNIASLNDGIEGITIPITWDSAISEIPNAENSIRINTIEKSCLLMFAVNRSSATESSFVLGTFDSDYAPSNLVIGTGIVSMASPTATFGCQVSINSNGEIGINNRGHSSSTFRGQIKWYY